MLVSSPWTSLIKPETGKTFVLELILYFLDIFFCCGLFGWLLVFLAFWLLGFSGFLASPASWLLGFAASRLFGLLASHLRDFWTFWFLGFSCFLASWLSSWLLAFSPPLPPQPPHPARFVVAIQACGKMTCHRHVCNKGRLCGSFCLQLGGAAPPPTPAPPCLRQKNHVITMGLRLPNPPAFQGNPSLQ